MFLADFITKLANRLSIDENSNDERGVPYRNRLIDKINEAYREVAQSHNWEFLRRAADIQTLGNVTGTCAVVNGSNQVTGGSGWTSDMHGRYFKSPTGNNWYRIAYVDVGNQFIYLETPMIEASGSGTYTIWKRYYYLKSEVDRVYDFGSWVRNGVLQNQPSRFIEDITTNQSNIGQPDFYSMYGTFPFESVYNTGTVTIAKDGNVLTGIGTSWLANVDAGDLLTIGTTKLRVKRVETDTQIITLNYCPNDFSSAQSYTTTKDTQAGFQFYTSADKQYVFPYTYFKRVFNMVHEQKDSPELPEKFDLAILDGAEAGMLRDLNSPKWVNKVQEYTARINDMKQRGSTSVPRYRVFSPNIPYTSRHQY